MLLTSRLRRFCASHSLERELWPEPAVAFRFRPYAPEHRAAVLALHDVNAPNRFPSNHGPIFAAHLDEQPEAFFVGVMPSDEVIACCGVINLGPHVHTLCYGLIAPAYQGKRIGSTMTLARLVFASRQSGMHMALIFSVPKSIGFYQRLGFEVLGTWTEGGKDYPVGALAYDHDVLAPIARVLKSRGHGLDPDLPVARDPKQAARVVAARGGGYGVEIKGVEEAAQRTDSREVAPRVLRQSSRSIRDLAIIGALVIVAVVLVLRASSLSRSRETRMADAVSRLAARQALSPGERARYWSRLRGESDDLLARELAVTALARSGDPEIVPFVLEQLSEAIIQAHEAGGSVRATMHPNVLLEALRRVAPHDPAVLRPLLQHPDERVVARVVTAHGSYGGNDEALRVLAAHLDHDVPQVRAGAATGLALLGDPKAEPIILSHLHDPSEAVRTQLGWALLNHGTWQAIPKLEEALARERDHATRHMLQEAREAIRAR